MTESELEAADDYANELRTEASVALDKFISLITFTPAYAKNMVDDLCLFMGPVADIQSSIQEAQKDDAQPDGSAGKSELPIQQSSASVPSHGTAGQVVEGDAELEQHSTSTSSARKRPVDETSPLPRPKNKRKKRHCRDAEDDMMQSDAELGAMEEQMTTEVDQVFDTERTTDMTAHEDGKPVHVSKRRDWTPEEDKTIKSYFKSGKTQQQIAVEVH
ncbi:hypothetical protein ACHAPJ_006407 [Fusarium lateritium]